LICLAQNTNQQALCQSSLHVTLLTACSIWQGHVYGMEQIEFHSCVCVFCGAMIELYSNPQSLLCRACQSDFEATAPLLSQMEAGISLNFAPCI
jgi:hypothetical protein